MVKSRVGSNIVSNNNSFLFTHLLAFNFTRNGNTFLPVILGGILVTLAFNLEILVPTCLLANTAMNDA